MNDSPIFDNYPLSGKLGELMPGDRVSDHFKRHAAKLDIPHTRFHDLRHTHASDLLTRNCSVLTVSKRLGHASPNITLQVYAHLMPNADEEMMAGFNDEHLRYKSTDN